MDHDVKIAVYLWHVPIIVVYINQTRVECLLDGSPVNRGGPVNLGTIAIEICHNSTSYSDDRRIAVVQCAPAEWRKRKKKNYIVHRHKRAPNTHRKVVK